MAERFSEFDARQVGEALRAEPQPTRDVAHGDGEALTVGETVLEVYPAAGVARVTTQDARLELYRVPAYSLGGERVVFEQGGGDNRSRLQVRADGKVAFHPVLRGVEPPTAGETPRGGRQDSPAGDVAPTATTAAYDNSSPTPEGQEIPPERLTGRLGRDPWFNHQAEPPMAGFPLAVNDERGQTTWHRVVVFGPAAQGVDAGLKAGQIKKGRLVDVTGQTVVREEPKTGGGVKRTTEFHATSVTRVQASRGGQPR